MTELQVPVAAARPAPFDTEFELRAFPKQAGVSLLLLTSAQWPEGVALFQSPEGRDQTAFQLADGAALKPEQIQTVLASPMVAKICLRIDQTRADALRTMLARPAIPSARNRNQPSRAISFLFDAGDDIITPYAPTFAPRLIHLEDNTYLTDATKGPTRLLREYQRRLGGYYNSQSACAKMAMGYLEAMTKGEYSGLDRWLDPAELGVVALRLQDPAREYGHFRKVAVPKDAILLPNNPVALEVGVRTSRDTDFKGLRLALCPSLCFDCDDNGIMVTTVVGLSPEADPATADQYDVAAIAFLAQDRVTGKIMPGLRNSIVASVGATLYLFASQADVLLQYGPRNGARIPATVAEWNQAGKQPEVSTITDIFELRPIHGEDYTTFFPLRPMHGRDLTITIPGIGPVTYAWTDKYLQEKGASRATPRPDFVGPSGRLDLSLGVFTP